MLDESDRAIDINGQAVKVPWDWLFFWWEKAIGICTQDVPEVKGCW